MNYVKPDTVVWLYSMDNCPWCVKAKLLLHTKGIEFVELNITKNPVLKDPAWKTLPQCYLGEKHIGGYTQLEAYFGNVV